MGCIFGREENKISKVQTSSFYVETKLDPVPKWAERDWETLVWRNNMTSDQDNIDQATEKLKDDEKMLQNNRNNFDVMVSDINGQMSKRRISLKNNQELLKDEVDRFIQNETDFWERADKIDEVWMTKERHRVEVEIYANAQIHTREEELKEKEESFEKKKADKENHIVNVLRGLELEKTQMKEDNLEQQKCKEEFKEKEESFMNMKTMSDKHLKQKQLFLNEKCEIIFIREEELKDKEGTFEEMNTAMLKEMKVEHTKKQKYKKEFKEKEELFIISDNNLKQEKVLLESKRIFLENKFENIHSREEVLKDKEETFEKMNTTLLKEMQRIGEASEIFKVRKEEMTETEEIFKANESAKTSCSI